MKPCVKWSKKGDDERFFIIENESVAYAAMCDESIALVMLKPADVLVISNWRYVHRIVDPACGNEKRFLTPLPGNDLNRLPVMISSGKESINLISGERNQMQVLISSQALSLVGQRGIVYTKIKKTQREEDEDRAYGSEDDEDE